MSTALVTGSSSGLGRELARVYAARGHNLVITARRETPLKELADELTDSSHARVLTIIDDLADPDAPQRIHAAVSAAGVEVDVLVNNAGVQPKGRLADHQWPILRDQIQLTMASPTNLIQLFLPGMLERRHGAILNIASIACEFPGSPKITLYGPAKSYLVRLTQGLAMEYPGSGVRFTAMIPGTFESPLLGGSGLLDVLKSRAPFLLADVRQLAERTVDASNSGRVVQVDGPVNRAVVALLRHLPLRHAHRIMDPNNAAFRRMAMGD